MTMEQKAGRRTCKCKANVVIQHHCLPDGTGILQLQHRLLLHAEHDDIFAADADLNTAISTI